MSIETRTEDGVVILDFQDDFVLTNHETFRKTFSELFADGETRFLFNLTGTRYMDSGSIGETVACLKRVRERGGDLKLVVEPDSKIRAMLELCALDSLFDVFDDEDAGLAGFAG